VGRICQIGCEHDRGAIAPARLLDQQFTARHVVRQNTRKIRVWLPNLIVA
jgi:hypothetical protein